MGNSLILDHTTKSFFQFLNDLIFLFKFKKYLNNHHNQLRIYIIK